MEKFFWRSGIGDLFLEKWGITIFKIPSTGREENDQHRSKVQVLILRLLEILKNLYVALNFDRSDR